MRSCCCCCPCPAALGIGIGPRLRSFLRDYDALQSLALALIYLQVRAFPPPPPPSSTGSAPPPGRDRLLFLRTERRESLSACPRFCGTYLLESTAAGGVRASWQRRICICGWCSRRLDCVGELGCLVQWGLGFRSSAWIKRRKRRSVVLVRSDFGVKCEVQCRHFARTANFPNSGEVACLSDYGPCHSLDSIPNLSGKASPTHLLLTQFSPHFGIFLLSKCLSMDIIVVIFALFTLTN